MAESSQRPALQAEPIPEEDHHSKAQDDEEAGWTIVSSKKSEQKKAVKYGVPSLPSIELRILGHANPLTNH